MRRGPVWSAAALGSVALTAALIAAMSGRPEVARHWMDWLNAHRTGWGSLPEKVLATGAPAGPAPLAWSAALVILTAAELESTSVNP